MIFSTVNSSLSSSSSAVQSNFHKSFRRFSLITLVLFSYLTFKTFPQSAQRPQILARNRIAAAATAKNE